MKNRRVLVLGGGVGGLSAAHELVERGFDVEVIELQGIPGGKARSVPVPYSGRHGREDLPGEHGFRFFPGFYQHLPDTMKRIPFQDKPQGCFDNLVPTSRIEIAQAGRPPLVTLSRFPTSLQDVRTVFLELVGNNTDLTREDATFFANKLWQVMTSCKERRLAELEQQTWWDFVDAENRSVTYQKFLASGLSRSLVAARAEEASARTVGQVQVHLASNIVVPGVAADRVLDGPTNHVWIYPWLAYLERMGVRYTQQTAVRRIDFQAGRIAGVEVRDALDPDKPPRLLEADYYVFALPVERMAPLITSGMVEADPSLKPMRDLAQNVRWMNGIQFYLREDVPVVHGHVLYVDSPWAITSISQHQFWPKVSLCNLGDGTVRGILSVDISDWDVEGRFIQKKARDCTQAEVAQEVWEELKESLNVGGQVQLRDDMLHSWYLDSDIVRHGHPSQGGHLDPRPLHQRPDAWRARLDAPLAVPAPDSDVNLEPLFINTPGSWQLRPSAVTAIPNLFLASDYVQTNTDLACMEAANEAARRAVNGILSASGNPAQPCRLFSMEMPEVLAPWRQHDLERFKKGLPWDGNLIR